MPTSIGDILNNIYNDTTKSLAVSESNVGITKTTATGTGAISVSKTAASDGVRLVSLAVHFSAAPTTSEYLTLTLDAAEGSAYDTVIFKVDPSGNASTDIVFVPDNDIILKSGDAFVVSYNNTDGVTYGVQLVTEG